MATTFICARVVEGFASKLGASLSRALTTLPTMDPKSSLTDTHPSLSELPSTLLDLLSNTLILDNVVPYLSVASIFALSRTAKSYRSFVQQNPRMLRYIDLSRCRGAYIPPSMTRVDPGGHSWRSQRMDEHLTEDDIYSGPLRGVLSKLSRTVSLRSVHTLVLDGLASVTSDLIAEILMDDKYDVWLLSVIGCVNLNPRKLQQLLAYVCRGSRPEGTPRLKGLYYFGTMQQQSSKKKAMESGSMATTGGVTCSEGAQLGSLPHSAQSTSSSVASNPWYGPTGRVLSEGHAQRSPWEETLQICKGIIAFDAVLCTHMHTAMAPFLHHASGEYLAEFKPTVAPLASMALGPAGCADCGRAPRDAPVWGESDLMEFPLLSSPPVSGRLADAVRPPPPAQNGQKQRLIVSCTWCLTNRHCESCHRWWCGACYDPKASAKARKLEILAVTKGLSYFSSHEELEMKPEEGKGESIKVFSGLCVENCLVGEMMAGAGSGGMWG